MLSAMVPEKSTGSCMTRAVRFLTGTVHSPSVLRAIAEFGKRFPDFRHVQYDAVSSSAMLDVHEETFGRRALPRPRFDAAEVIVGIAFDSGGVTTSTVTVPLVTALGVGLATSIRGRNPLIDGFGMIALASLTPMIFVMLLGIIRFGLGAL